MKKILNTLFNIASLGLISAGVIFLCVSIFDGNETMMPLMISLACILLANLFHVIRMNMDKKCLYPFIYGRWECGWKNQTGK